MAERSTLDLVALVLMVVGSVNWGLVGLGSWMGMNLNVVNLVLGSMPMLANLVYVLVGLAGLYGIYYLTQ